MKRNMDDEKLVRSEIWEKVKQTAGKISFVEDVVAMYFCAIDFETPTAVKLTIFGALAYFILPVDAIPDIIPGGYTDDAGVIAAVLATINAYVTDDHRKKAKNWLNGNTDEPYMYSLWY